MWMKPRDYLAGRFCIFATETFVFWNGIIQMDIHMKLNKTDLWREEETRG